MRNQIISGYVQRYFYKVNVLLCQILHDIPIRDTLLLKANKRLENARNLAKE